MKKIIFALMLLLAAVTFAQVNGVDPFDVPEVAAAKMPFVNLVLITEAMAGIILTWTQGIKKLLESPILKWVLTLTGRSEVKPYLAVALSIVAAIASGIIAYQAGGITVGELLAMVPAAWGQAIGAFSLIKKASGFTPAVTLESK